jgi:CubicO group peptidase (beta-lactamase class C family)
MRAYDVPGVEVAVVQDGRVVHLKGFGVRRIGSAEPVTPDTLMKVGSITKSMTTMMIGTLVDDGSLTWETRATDIVPWFSTSNPSITAQLTVRDMVSNATGLQRRDVESIFTSDELDADRVLKSLKNFAFDPDSTFRKTYGYSNQMVASGGYIAAQAAPGAKGDLFADFVSAIEHRVWDPIGMSSSTFAASAAEHSGDVATPHGRRLDYTLVPLSADLEELTAPFAPAGGAWSNARDMARYLQTELAVGVAPDGARIVSEAGLTKTWQPQVTIAPGQQYGLGWFISDYKGQLRIAHGGDTPGFGADIDFLPQSGLGVVVLSNAGTTSPLGAGVAGRLYELAFDQPAEADANLHAYYGGLRDAYLGADRQVQVGGVREDFAPYEGTYRAPGLGELTLVVRGGRPVADAGEFATELAPVAPGTYILMDPPLPAASISFARDANGRQRFTFVTNNPYFPGTWVFTKER